MKEDDLICRCCVCCELQTREVRWLMAQWLSLRRGRLAMAKWLSLTSAMNIRHIFSDAITCGTIASAPTQPTPVRMLPSGKTVVMMSKEGRYGAGKPRKRLMPAILAGRSLTRRAYLFAEYMYMNTCRTSY